MYGQMAKEQNSYVRLLAHNVVYLHESNDELVWSWNSTTRCLIEKLAYEALNHGTGDQ